jgi:hypothetical protein
MVSDYFLTRSEKSWISRITQILEEMSKDQVTPKVYKQIINIKVSAAEQEAIANFFDWRDDVYYNKKSKIIMKRPDVLSWCGSKDEIQAFMKYRSLLNATSESSVAQQPAKGRRKIKAIREGDKKAENAKDKREKQVERVEQRRLEQLERAGDKFGIRFIILITRCDDQPRP